MKKQEEFESKVLVLREAKRIVSSEEKFEILQVMNLSHMWKVLV